MMAWTVLFIVLLVLFLIGRIKLGGMVEYSAQGLLVKLRFGAIWLQLYPRKKKDKAEKEPPKKKKEKKTSQEKPEEPKKTKGGALDLVKQYLPLVGEAAGGMRKRITIDRLYLDFTAASRDPAGAAMSFGYANMALGMLWPIFEQNFVVKDHRLCTNVDFTAQNTVVYLNAAVSILIGQLLSFALRLLWCFFRLYRQGKGERE